MSGIRDLAQLRRLNLGSGHFKDEDCINVDIDLRTEPDMSFDLEEVPYPFEDGRFEQIRASHVLEHLTDPFAAMREWHRLLSPGGELHIRVPHFTRGFTHPDHRRGFDVSFPLFFDPEMKPWFCGTELELRHLRLRWNDQPYLKRYVTSAPVRIVAEGVGLAIDALANLWPMASSRLFAFWVGGFEAIEFVFVRPRGTVGEG